MEGTKQSILDKALELFNKKGIEYIGMRELATELDIRVGNITYYFPTKDELVSALSDQYSAHNGKLFVNDEGLSLFSFLEKRKPIFLNQSHYRCLHVSFVHLLERNEFIKKNYEKVRQQRVEALKKAVQILQEKKYISVPLEDEEILLALIAMTGRSWLAEASVAHKHLSVDKQIKFYLRVFANLFKPYASKKGLSDIGKFLDTL